MPILNGASLSGYNLQNISKIQLAQHSHASLINTVADGTGVSNPSGVLTVTLTGTNDELLTPPSTPQPVTGGNYNGYEMITGMVGSDIGEDGMIEVVDGYLVIKDGGNGFYETPHAYIGFSSSANNNEVGLIFGIERDGLLYFSQRVTGARLANSDAITNLSGGGSLTLFEGDKITPWISSERDADISVYDANLGLKMIYSTD